MSSSYECRVRDSNKPRFIRNRNNGGDSATSSRSVSIVTDTQPNNSDEDLKISKLLRRLSGETRITAILDTCSKLKYVMAHPSNASYIRRSFDILADAVIGAFETTPSEAHDAVADVFGLMGLIMKNEFPTFKAWIVKVYKNHKHLKVPMMKSLSRTLTLDVNSSLKNFSMRLIELLKDFLEGTDNANVFLAVLEAIVKFSQKYPKDFAAHFNDIIDICIGWHLEPDQKTNVRQECSILLQQLNNFWRRDIKSTKSLLGQFLEDIESCKVFDLDHVSSGPAEMSLGSFISAFNTTIKCLYPAESVVPLLGIEFLQQSFVNVMVIATQVIAAQSSEEELIVPTNEFINLLLEIFQSSSIDSDVVQLAGDLLQEEVKCCENYNERMVVSLLQTLNTYILTIKNDLPLTTVDALLRADSKLMLLKFNVSSDYQEPLVDIFHSILDIKNVSILQEAYKHILNDFQRCFIGMNEMGFEIGFSDLPPYNLEEAMVSLTLSLSALAKLATASNSIMAMWALQPSILEILGVKFQLFNDAFWSSYLQHNLAAFKLLACHCIRNNNFVSSSSLLKSTSDAFNHLSLESASPTALNFKMILTFLAEFSANVELIGDRLFIFLDWVGSIFAYVGQHLTLLVKQKSFLTIITALAQYSLVHNQEVSILCADSLLNLNTVSMDLLPDDLLHQIAQVCCLQMCNVNQIVRSKFSHIFAFLPLRVSLQEVTGFTGINRDQANHITNLQHWHFSSATTGDVKGQYFKEFIKHIRFAKDQTFIEDFLQNVFMHCWNVRDVTSSAYADMAFRDIRPLITWMQWEAAQYCVNNKLRTTLGKPQDTFLKIEALIKEDARILSLKETPLVKDLSAKIANQKSARILLGFLEALEKSIHNAADGTAFALPAFDKPAKTFFRMNAPTCNEWFKRIRTAVDLVALHCMEAEQVIRYSEAVLKDLAAANRFDEPVFEHTLMSLVWALIRNVEANALYGVYAWAKKVTGGKRYTWIKMAAEQAAGHREVAVVGYIDILKDDETQKLDPHIRDFIVDMTTFTFLFNQNWHGLAEFLKKEEARAIPRATIPLIAITSKMAESIAKHDDIKDYNVADLSDWSMLTEEDEVKSNFSVHKVTCLAENSLCHLIFGVAPEPEKLREKVFNVIHNFLQECLRTGTREYLIQLTVANHICFKTIHGNYEDVHSLHIDKSYGSVPLCRLLYWTEFFNDYTAEGEQQCIDIRLDTVSVARKECNLQMSRVELEKYYKKSGIGRKWGLEDAIKVETVRNLLLNGEKGADNTLWDTNFARAAYEHCKLIQCLPEEKQHAISLASCVSGHLYDIVEADPANNKPLRERLSRFMLTLSEWVQHSEVNSMQLAQFAQKIPALSTSFELASVIPQSEELIGRLVQESARQCPDLAKTWLKMGAWFYRWGRKLVEQKNDQGSKLSTFDIVSITSVVQELKEDDIRVIGDIFHQHQASAEEEDICNQLNTTEIIENQLRLVPSLSHVSAENINAIIDIWKQAHKTVYSYYEKAAEAYFKFLQVACSSQMNEDKIESSLVNATLRLLRLIAKHALGLQDVLEQGLATTPTRPWKSIIPQLFSRLNHHEPYVRRRVSELLCRIAESSSHLIIFPSVVGTGQKLSVDVADISMATSTDPEEVEANKAKEANLTFCFNSLLDTLSKRSPQAVNQAQTLVKELRRITLLYDEIWTVSLNHLANDMAKKINNFNNEVITAKEQEDFQDKLEIFSDKYKLLMRPFTFVVEYLIEMTSRPPETNNEKNFQEKFLKLFQKLAVELQCPFDPENPMAGWQKFKVVHQQMQQRAQRRSAFMLKMSDISPVLANIRDTVISMPGHQPSGNQLVFIKAVDENVVILPTKTKPKKLIFYGSDGKKYAYLFKGLEDLHLDERIMQFLSIANLIMTDTIDCNGNITRYRALNYSVIPLGPRSGLISWVDGVVPIFALYKKWQQREAANPKKNAQFVVKRPSEMYYEKLTPLLQAAGQKTTDPRKDWPVPILKQVLSNLQKETPRDLLAKELWCHSTNAAEWRAVVKSYSLSIAVMSVIGYVIGLGDRHLDNMLINLASGEILHIDYNVCFEKGKTLRVPEKIPFRMTPNLEEALGVTGIEGIFRLSSEHVLDSLKKSRETLLTLLEAFVYDPLVDWAISHDMAGGLAITTTYNCMATRNDLHAASKTLEREVTRDTLAIRFTEIKPEWTQNKLDTRTKLQDMNENLHHLIDRRYCLRAIEEKRQSTQQQIEMILNLERTEGNISAHPLSNISQRYELFKMHKDEFTRIRNMINDRISANEQLLKDYQQNVRDGIHGKLNLPNETQTNEFEIVKDFLLNSTQNATFSCGNQNVKEYQMLEDQHVKLLRTTCEILQQYIDVSQFLSPDYKNFYCVLKHLEWLRQITQCNNGVEACQKVQLLYQMNMSELENQGQAPHIFSFAYQLNGLQNEANAKIQRHYEELKRVSDGFAQYKEAEKSLGTVKKATVVGMIQDTVRKGLLLEQNNTSVDLDTYCDFTLTLASIAGVGKNNHAVKFLKTVKQVYATIEGLQDIFYCKIVPNTLHSIFSGDQSVLDMIADISCLYKEATKYADVESNTKIRAKHESLVKLYEESGTEGAKLLLEMNALFTAVQVATKEVFGCFPEKNNADITKKALQILKCQPEEFDKKNDTFFVIRLKAIVDFFTSCLQYACGLKGTMGQAHSTERLCEPIAHFATSYTWQFILGMGTYAMSVVLCEMLVEMNGLKEIKPEDRGADKVCRNFEKVWQNKRHAVRLDRSIKREKKNLSMLQLISSAHFWLHEHILVTQPALFNFCPISRAGLLIQLRQAIDGLNMVKQSMKKPKAELSNATADVIARLKWAVGANPSLTELYEKFTDEANKRVEKVSRQETLNTICVTYATSIWNFEIQRLKTPEGLEKDNEVFGMIASFEKACILLGQVASVVSPFEESLIEILDPKGVVTVKWVKEIQPLLNARLQELQHEIGKEEKQIGLLEDKISNIAHTLRNILHNNLKIASEIRNLLKNVLKLSIFKEKALREYFVQYKEFFDILSELCTNILSKDFTEQMLQISAQQLQTLLSGIDYAFDEVFAFDYVGLAADDYTQTRDVACYRNPRVPSHREQKRNAYAVSVWRRIRMKLEGRDRDPNRRLAIPEQIDWIITEAMNTDNLAVLYEGWTPWV